MAGTAPAIGLSVTVQIDDKRGIVAQTHVDQDAPQEAIDAILDKVMATINRQSLIAELEMWKRKKYSDEKNIVELDSSLERAKANAIDIWAQSGKRGDYKPSTQDLQHEKQLLTGRDRAVEGIAIANERIAEISAKLGMRDVA